MTERAPRPASPLELPPAALHARTHNESHPDSEESTQRERQRVSRELDSLHLHGVSTSSYAPTGSRNVPVRSATTSREYLQRRTSALSSASTQAEVDVPHGEDASQREVREKHWYNTIVKFWTTHISLTIGEGAHRDHLALERTFLGYLRTSLILVMAGVTIAQLFRLQHTANPDPSIGFYVIGLPLSVAFISLAIVVLLIGAFRFWKLQQALCKGVAHSGGWEVVTIMGLSALLLIASFALVLAVNIDKSLEGS